MYPTTRTWIENVNHTPKKQHLKKREKSFGEVCLVMDLIPKLQEGEKSGQVQRKKE